MRRKALSSGGMASTGLSQGPENLLGEQRGCKLDEIRGTASRVNISTGSPGLYLSGSGEQWKGFEQRNELGKRSASERLLRDTWWSQWLPPHAGAQVSENPWSGNY